jgi:hypothetical protein
LAGVDEGLLYVEVEGLLYVFDLVPGFTEREGAPWVVVLGLE